MHTTLVANIAAFGEGFGPPIMTPNLSHFGLKLLYRNPGLTKQENNPQSKTQIRI